MTFVVFDYKVAFYFLAVVMLLYVPWSVMVLIRLRLAFKRLYKMNFRGMEIAREMIANDLHDYVGFTIVKLRNVYRELITAAKHDRNLQFKIGKADVLLYDLHFNFRNLIENTYPKDISTNWRQSFKNLIDGFALGERWGIINIDVQMEFDEITILHIYRIAQEELSNIFNHNAVSFVLIEMTQIDDSIELMFKYKANNISINKVFDFKHKWALGGRGAYILKERLRFLNGSRRFKSDGINLSMYLTFNFKK